jgi:hypothetical protein
VTSSTAPNRTTHRAVYTLELGIWHATCRECGFRVSDADRRRAAAVYRQHIKTTNLQAGVSQAPLLDLTEPVTPERARSGG